MKILDKSMQLAYDLFPGRSDKFMHFAFLYERNKLLSIGQNNMTSTNGKAAYFGRRYNVPEFVNYSYLHAEIDAISRIWSKVRVDNRLKLVIIRLGQSGNVLNSRPCNKCQVVLDALGLNKIWWSIPTGFEAY